MPLSSSLVRPWPLTSRPQLLRAVAIPAVRQPPAARARRCQTLRAEPPRSTTKWVWEQQLSACRGSVMRLSVSSDQTHAVITQTPHTHELWASASHVWMSVLFHFSYISGLFVYYLSMSVWTRQAGQWFENVFTESSLTCVCVSGGDSLQFLSMNACLSFRRCVFSSRVLRCCCWTACITVGCMVWKAEPAAVSATPSLTTPTDPQVLYLRTQVFPYIQSVCVDCSKFVITLCYVQYVVEHLWCLCVSLCWWSGQSLCGMFVRDISLIWDGPVSVFLLTVCLRQNNWHALAALKLSRGIFFHPLTLTLLLSSRLLMKKLRFFTLFTQSGMWHGMTLSRMQMNEEPSGMWGVCVCVLGFALRVFDGVCDPNDHKLFAYAPLHLYHTHTHTH